VGLLLNETDAMGEHPIASVSLSRPSSQRSADSSQSRYAADTHKYLRPKQLLIVLDNFEQVGGAPLVAALLVSAQRS
jgi:hypothetical protein